MIQPDATSSGSPAGNSTPAASSRPYGNDDPGIAKHEFNISHGSRNDRVLVGGVVVDAWRVTGYPIEYTSQPSPRAVTVSCGCSSTTSA